MQVFARSSLLEKIENTPLEISRFINLQNSFLPLLIFITSFIILHPRSRFTCLSSLSRWSPSQSSAPFLSVCLFSTHSPSPIPNCQLINIDPSANSHAARPLLVWNQYIKLVKLLVARLLHQRTKNRLYQS